MTATEPTLAALRKAAEQVREACHAAYTAPRHTQGLYDRIGAVHSLLARTEQAVDDLRKLASSLAVDPPDRLFSDDDHDPRSHLVTVVEHLLDAARFVRYAHADVNDAWSSASHLGIDPGADAGDAS